MNAYPYLTFNGDCEEAFHFYEQILGAKIKFIMPHEGSPMDDRMSPEWAGKILHASLTMGDTVLFGSDSPAEHYRRPQGFHLSLDFKEVAEAEVIFAALADGGGITMPLQATFWAARFGMLTDKFGIPWMVNCEQS